MARLSPRRAVGDLFNPIVACAPERDLLPHSAPVHMGRLGVVDVTANADQSVWYWDGTYWFGGGD
jgi:hypothetical protein